MRSEDDIYNEICVLENKIDDAKKIMESWTADHWFEVIDGCKIRIEQLAWVLEDEYRD